MDRVKVDDIRAMEHILDRYPANMDNDQLTQIKAGIDSDADISIYADSWVKAGEMYQIRLGLEAGLDVTSYINKRLNENQMREIRLGLKNGVDVSVYASIDVN